MRGQTDARSGSKPAEWFFFSGGPGVPRYGDDPTKHAVDHDTETFVREVLQNANDAGPAEGNEPIEVAFNFVSLSGSERRDFLEALGWGDELSERLKSIVEPGEANEYDDVLARIEDEDAELRLLIVEDRNTTGLTGRWGEDSNYAALVRDELYSSKEDEKAGGSYGLGKSVLWTFSGISTVVFDSVLAESDSSLEGDRRLIGRTKLPTHTIVDETKTYQGAGWLCRPVETPQGTRPGSIWGDEAKSLAHRLHVSRPPVSGTSAMVVDYRDPTRDERPDMEDLSDQFVEAAVKYFWPAIYRDELRVTVEVDGETRRADVRDVDSIQPFVECFESRYDCDDRLDKPGDVAGLDVPVELPPRAKGNETADGRVRLAAKFASPADDDTYQNLVALFRGSGMVVRYLDQSRVAFGDRNFHAVLACGESRSPNEVKPGDEEIERFLRCAEPPEHDEWESTENLRTNYQRGFRTALDGMFDTLRDALRHLLSNSEGRGETLTARVRQRFPIHGGKAGVQGNPVPDPAFEIRGSTEFRGDRWTFGGRVTTQEDGFPGWTAEISLTGVGEDGASFERVPIEDVECEHQDVRVVDDGDGAARLTAGPGATDVEFEGESTVIRDNDAWRGRVGETRLEIEVRPEADEEAD